MLCEQCGMKEAEVHLVNVIKGERHVSHLCRECAASRMHLEDVTNIIKMQFSLNGLTNIEEAFRDLVIPVLKKSRENIAEQHICPHCGGVLPEEMFNNAKEGVRPAQQNNDRRIPYEEPADIASQLFVMSAEEEMADLSKKMNDAVKTENYETAAKLRDRISELKHMSAQEKHN